jgi:hypothetical protein
MAVVAWFTLAVTALFAIVWIAQLVWDEIHSGGPGEHDRRATR